MSKLELFDDLAAFKARAEGFLLAREAENNLLFGLIAGIERGYYPEPLLGVLAAGDGPEAVAIRTPPYNLVLSRASREATEALAALLEPPLPGVNAEAAQAAAFADSWARRTGAQTRRTIAQRIYELTEVRPPAGVPGTARLATKDDRDLLIAWMRDFAAEALPPGDPLATDTDERIDRVLSANGMTLWENGDQPVCMVGHAAPTPNGTRVGPVYTPPDARGRGYASAATAEVSARILASGKRFCFLYTDLGNPTSNAIYRRIGYRPVCDASVYRFDG